MSIFKKLFGFKKENSSENLNSSKSDGLNTPMEEVKRNTEGYINLGRSIFPVLKREDDEGIKITENINPLVKIQFIDGIVLCFVIDTGYPYEQARIKCLDQRI